MVFTIEQLVFMVEEYVRSGSFAKCRNKFAERFPDIAKVPNKSTIHRTVQRFRQTGSVLKKKRSTELRKSTLTVVRQCLERTPGVSVKELSKHCGLNRDTCRLALARVRSEPGLPDKPDKQKRVDYCSFFNENYLGDPGLGDLSFYTGEATFHLSGEVNSLNSHFPGWTTNAQCPSSDLKVGVWCAISRRRIIGPIFFEGPLTPSVYVSSILRPFVDQLHDDEIQFGYLQHDESVHHRSARSVDYLGQYFGDRLVSAWPPGSPDLSVTDFFLWAYLRSRCYESCPRTLTALRANIAHVLDNITAATLRQLSDNISLRVQACFSVGGEEFQHMIS